MAVDWSLARQPNVLAMALDGYEQGRKLRQEEASKKALAAMFGGNSLAPNALSGITSTVGAAGSSVPTLDPILSPGGGIGGGRNPNADMYPIGSNAPAADGIDYSALTPEDLRTAITLRNSQREQQQAQAKAKGEQFQQLGRILNHATDETTYQQSLAAAKQIGLDVSNAPPSFDPNWVNQQKLVLQAYEKDGGQQISGLARELTDAGYKPGTPEFAAAMRTALQGKYAPTYTDEQGNMRQGQLPPLPGQAQQAAPQAVAQPRKPVTVQAAMQVVQQAGPRAAEFIRNNGFAVQVTTPDEARQLPSGTPIILPDGSEGVVP